MEFPTVFKVLLYIVDSSASPVETMSSRRRESRKRVVVGAWVSTPAIMTIAAVAVNSGMECE